MNNRLDTITNLFDGSEIRSIWDSEKEDYYFSVVDVISALTGSSVPKRYWKDLKRRLIDEGSQLYENIVQLKLFMKTEPEKECSIMKKISVLSILIVWAELNACHMTIKVIWFKRLTL